MNPRTPNQVRYVKSLQNVSKPIVIATGPPGTGKTMLPCQVAAEKFKSGDVRKIVLTRPIVCAGEDLGYLPGSIENKMDPWTRPMFDILENYFARSRIKQMVDNRTIEISPLAYMRGRTFNNCFIIADEMQNSTQQQMKMVLTRLGDDSQMARGTPNSVISPNPNSVVSATSCFVSMDTRNSLNTSNVLCWVKKTSRGTPPCGKSLGSMK